MDPFTEERARIAAQRGELRGWRPLTVGDVAVTALQVLGMVRAEEDTVGLRVVVAGRTPEIIEAQGLAVAERLLRARAVLAPEDPFVVVSVGEMHEGAPPTKDGAFIQVNEEFAAPLHCPWVAWVFHVPVRQLPAIAGLATDTVPEPGSMVRTEQ